MWFGAMYLKGDTKDVKGRTFTQRDVLWIKSDYLIYYRSQVQH